MIPRRPRPSAPRPPPGRAAPGCQRGFSLLEVLLVVGLIAVTGVLAAAAMSGGFDRIALQSTAKELAAQLRYTRTQAIVTGEPQRFVLDPQARTWRAPNGRHGEIPAKLDVEFTGARELQTSHSEGAIVFFADGAATGGRIRVMLRGAAWQVDVAWLTGEVRLGRGEQ
ncbi:GspH/FimT family pseudopilin [Luteimonas sp. gir]|uniref:type II secretion system protein XpsH n=1 Tax=Luteimonas sp. gir TaxID=3127960 RepID=UPI003075B259